jgi:hypothetical protein
MMKYLPFGLYSRDYLDLPVLNVLRPYIIQL